MAHMYMYDADEEEVEMRDGEEEADDTTTEEDCLSSITSLRRKKAET